MKSLAEIQIRFRLAYDSFRSKWRQTRASWLDVIGTRFEKQYVQPLEKQTKVTLKALEELTAVIEQAKRQIK